MLDYLSLYADDAFASFAITTPLFVIPAGLILGALAWIVGFGIRSLIHWLRHSI